MFNTNAEDSYSYYDAQGRYLTTKHVYHLPDGTLKFTLDNTHSNPKDSFNLKNELLFYHLRNLVNTPKGETIYMLVLEISLDPNKVETDREDNLWVNRAGQSLAETIRLVVSRILDVEFTELMTGYRVRKNQTGAYIDVYIYDSLSSGAGYAVAVASVMPEVLERAEALLKGCDCENACYNCLKHYRNQNVHGMLDRFAALDLLNWAKDNSLAPMLSIDMQKKLLAPLGNVLKYADIILSANGDELSVKKNLFHKALKIYPAMWKKPEAKDTIYISDACVKYAKPSAVKKIIDGL